MSALANVRLQGGPFDGERQHGVLLTDLPAKIWVERCWKCGSHWYQAEDRNREPYRRDEEDERGWLLYVWCDPNLTPPAEADERELVPAGGIHDEEDESE